MRGFFGVFRAAKPRWGRQGRGWGKAIKAAKRRTAAKALKAGRKREIPVFAKFASLANMDPRTVSELNAKKEKKIRHRLHRT